MKLRGFIPETHEELRQLRLFFPGRLGEDSLSWRSLLTDSVELPPDADWHELRRAALETGLVPALATAMPPTGRLGAVEAAALQSAVGMLADPRMTCLHWRGYEHQQDVTASTRVVDGNIYTEAALTPDDLSEGRYLPSFAWDNHGALAWGSRPYPDSVVIAARDYIFRALHQDEDIETVSITRSTIIPPSAGD